MKYLTIDVELADHILPSVCNIAIVHWEDGRILKTDNFLINPDCEMIDFLRDHHHLSEEDLDEMPYFHEVWGKIYSILENKMVFAHFGNRTISVLMQRAMIDHFRFPDLVYGCTYSIANRLKIFSKDIKMPSIKKGFNTIPTLLSDAISCGKIIDRAVDHLGCSYDDLFEVLGYAGGSVKNGKKHFYRSYREKNGKYQKRFFNSKYQIVNPNEV